MGAGASANAKKLKTIYLKDIQADENIITDPNQCSCPYLKKCEGIYHCLDCAKTLNNTDDEKFKNENRIHNEQEKERDTRCIDNDEQNSTLQGVSIEFLLYFTHYFNCWDWNAHDIIRKIIKPMTKETRCRFIDLPWMKTKSLVGEAFTYVSYAHAGSWGDVVAAVLDGAVDHSRCVWVDIFTHRQWPTQNESEILDFATTIEKCSSFMIVCSYNKEIKEVLDLLKSQCTISRTTINIFSISPSVRKTISFMRQWCLLEAAKACSLHKPFILKCGNYCIEDDGLIRFDVKNNLLQALLYLIDAVKSEVSLPSDKVRLLHSIQNGDDIEMLNVMLKGAVMLTMTEQDIDCNLAAVQCAACGDESAFHIVKRDTNNLYSIAAAGYTNLLEKCLDYGDNKTKVNEVNSKGSTLLIYAVSGGHDNTVKLLLDKYNANIHLRSHDISPLHIAVTEGYMSTTKLLLESGANPNDQDSNYTTCLMSACKYGHEDLVNLLLENHASINDVDKKGRTAIAHAYNKEHESIIKILLSHGACADISTKHSLLEAKYLNENLRVKYPKNLLKQLNNINRELTIDETERVVLRTAKHTRRPASSHSEKRTILSLKN